ncbi:TPR-like protein [Glonium stellatum]|uniref:TPR-like protein n=1 Tax=Glonium stellatum TaxID=574774 RepID=A0A8E2JQI9_9PEZI|nr:TPR-like protein [Glonium stellatum]
MGIQESEKALRYIAQLDDSRCNGRWQDVPELARKIEKHAPHRRCLALTARSETQVAAYSTQRPSSATSTNSANLSKIIPSLLTAIEEETDHAQDAFQANICLGWLHFILDEPGLAVARLPKDFAAAISSLSRGEKKLDVWTQVCFIKGAYLKGFSQEKTASAVDALATYNAVLPFLSSFNTWSSASPQFRLWTERLLGRLCLLSDQSTSSGLAVESSHALRTFRMWARFWEAGVETATVDNPETGRLRRLVWKAYYDTLSVILQRDLRYSPASTSLEPELLDSSEKLPAEEHLNSRIQQRAELKRVETTYEGLLLKETHFPKASESNVEIELWVDAVMNNWKVLCGVLWQDEELGEGGKEGVGGGVLDILYRAATKSFHSTKILRHLFTVHTSLAQFDLAFKAYDSYVEIVSRGKDRAEKSGEEDLSLDNDDTILCTAAEAIRILCRFGSYREAEKARDIGQSIERWLKQHTPSISLSSPTPAEKDFAKASEEPTKYKISPQTLAVAYRAVGISQAQWARVTYDAELRTSIQTQAVYYLRKALEPKFEDSHSLETLYALGLVLAEMRDVAGAIKIIKRALSPASNPDSSITADGLISDEGSVSSIEFTRERKLIPIWHLLALLLSARSDFSTAEKSCEAAFEQFEDPSNLFGKNENTKEYRSDHLKNLPAESQEKASNQPKGIVDRMETFEKNGIVEIKMTQLALIEILEGTNAAVDVSDELLALYARLFGDPVAGQIKIQLPTTPIPPPKSAAGTIKGSIFRPRTSRRSAEKAFPAATNTSIASSRPSTVATQATAPTIQVTDEDSPDHANGHHHSLNHKHHAESPTQKRSGSVKLQKRSANSLRRRSEVDDGMVETKKNEIDKDITNGKPRRHSSTREKSPRRKSISGSVRKSTEGSTQPLRPVAHNMPHRALPPPASHSKQQPHQDIRLPTPSPDVAYTSPEPRFTVLQERRHKISLLVKVWLFISGLYTRAGMFDDAKGAIEEAVKLVESLELEVARESSSSKAFANQGWGGGKSVDELWGDVWSGRGELLQSQSLPHEAMTEFEKAVSHFPDHALAIVGLSNILFDIYCKIIPPEPPQVTGVSSTLSTPSSTLLSTAQADAKKLYLASSAPSAENQTSPPELNRLAARDRAHGLLSSLTKLGSGWDYSEAWFALARSYEECGQVEKAKEVLWWCVELEDTHPARKWGSVGVGGFVL